MFIGHFAVAFGARKYTPQVSLGVLFLACQLADIVWPNLVLLGIETVQVQPGITAMTPLNFVSYPWSHSLVALLVWSALFVGIYAWLAGGNTRALIVITVLIVSHWLLDVLTHRPDVPVTIGGDSRLGIGLWNFPVVAVTVELTLFALGVWLYTQHSRALDRFGSIGFWLLAAFLLVVYIANVLGPPPPSVEAVAWSAQALWLVVLWGFWVDRHREAR